MWRLICWNKEYRMNGKVISHHTTNSSDSLNAMGSLKYSDNICLRVVCGVRVSHHCRDGWNAVFFGFLFRWHWTRWTLFKHKLSFQILNISPGFHVIIYNYIHFWNSDIMVLVRYLQKVVVRKLYDLRLDKYILATCQKIMVVIALLMSLRYYVFLPLSSFHLSYQLNVKTNR